MEDLTRRARGRGESLREEVAARDALPHERHAAEGDVGRARTALEGYRTAHERALSEFGPAALGDAPDPGELDARLIQADGLLERAGRAASAGRFAEARSLLREASGTAAEAMRAPGDLKQAVAGADRRKRAGEEKLNELEARLARAKANEHLMAPLPAAAPQGVPARQRPLRVLWGRLADRAPALRGPRHRLRLHGRPLLLRQRRLGRRGFWWRGLRRGRLLDLPTRVSPARNLDL